MSVMDGALIVMFQTDAGFLKCEQIRHNPYVALCVENAWIEGTTRIACCPLDHEFFSGWLPVQPVVAQPSGCT